MIDLRPYQREAFDGGRDFPGIFPTLRAHRGALLILATGLGKTVVFAEVCRRGAKAARRMLVLAHRDELVRQAVDKIERLGVRCEIEMGESFSSRLSPPPVVVASVQTLSKPKRLEQFARDRFDLVIVDECHHAAAATYRRILDHFETAKRLGVTATPGRLDGKGIGPLFGPVAYAYDLRSAILDGWLAPIVMSPTFIDGLDFSRVRVTAGDLNEGDLEQVMMEIEAVTGVAKQTIAKAGERPTMVFAVTVAHAQALAAAFNNEIPGCAVALDGKTKDDVRRGAIEDFAAGRFQFLINCGLFLEGFDCPSIACIAVARPTQSQSLYMQILGRGTRLYPGKKNLLVIDFEGNAGRHSLMTPMDALDGNTDEEVKVRVKKILAEQPIGEQTVMEVIEQAAQQLAAEERARRLEEVRRVVRGAGVRARSMEFDPFATVEAILGIRPISGRGGGVPVSPGQEKWLRDLKLEPSAFDSGQASQIFDEIKRRSDAGLATFNQLRALFKRGIDATQMSKADASLLLDEIAQREGWNERRAAS